MRGIIDAMRKCIKRKAGEPGVEFYKKMRDSQRKEKKKEKKTT